MPFGRHAGSDSSSHYGFLAVQAFRAKQASTTAAVGDASDQQFVRLNISIEKLWSPNVESAVPARHHGSKPDQPARSILRPTRCGRVGSWRGGDVLVLGPEALVPAVSRRVVPLR